jgi:hypothetical protein
MSKKAYLREPTIGEIENRIIKITAGIISTYPACLSTHLENFIFASFLKMLASAKSQS